MTDQPSVEDDVPVWCSEHMEPYCPRHAEPACPPTETAPDRGAPMTDQTDRDTVEAVAEALTGHMVGTQMQRALSRDDALALADAVLPLIREARDLADDESASRVHLANQLIVAERRLAEVEASVRDREAVARERALREAANDWATGEWADAFAASGVDDDVSAVRAMERWLLDRAANPYTGSEGE